jgi:hypothetical protein
MGELSETDTFAHSTMRRTGALHLSCQASGNPSSASF